MKEITLSTEGLPIRFLGEHICTETTRKEVGPDSGRWWRAELYRLGDGSYRVGIAYITIWKDPTKDERHRFYYRDGHDKKTIIEHIHHFSPELAEMIKESWKDGTVGSRLES